MFVRDPFERAVSGYYNRVVLHHRMDFLKGRNKSNELVDDMGLREFFEILIRGNTLDEHFKVIFSNN